jgi:hypothetical protein
MTFNELYHLIKTENSKEDVRLLEEGLIKSFPIETIKQSIGKMPWSGRITPELVMGIPVGLTVELKPNVVESELDSILRTHGYFVSDSRKIKGVTSCSIEPKYSIVFNYSKIKYLYHITFREHLASIKKIGLTPRNSTRPNFHWEGNRIYLLATTNPDHDTLMVASALLNNESANKHSLDDCRVLQIDTSQLVHGTFRDQSVNQTLYFDPKLTLDDITDTCLGVFSLQNIKPSAIKVMDF